MTTFAYTFEPSSSAASFVGPNALIPAAVNASTTPFTLAPSAEMRALRLLADRPRAAVTMSEMGLRALRLMRSACWRSTRSRISSVRVRVRISATKSDA